jgi:TPR repeat protein
MIIYGGCVQRGLVSPTMTFSPRLFLIARDVSTNGIDNVSHCAIRHDIDEVFRNIGIDSAADVDILIGRVAKLGINLQPAADSNDDVDRSDSLLSEAIVWYARAAALGHAQAACNLAIACEQRMQDMFDDNSAGSTGREAAANSGVGAKPSAQNHGDGVGMRHRMRALVHRLYRLAAERGSAAAMVNLALGLQRGEFRIADDNGDDDKDGQNSATGAAFPSNLNSVQTDTNSNSNPQKTKTNGTSTGNSESALDWFRRAADLGDAQAARCVALCADADADADAEAAEGGNTAQRQRRRAIATQWYVEPFVPRFIPIAFFSSYVLIKTVAWLIHVVCFSPCAFHVAFYVLCSPKPTIAGTSAPQSSATRMPCMNSAAECAMV